MIRLSLITIYILLSPYLTANHELREHLLKEDWSAAEKLIAKSNSLDPNILMFTQDGPDANVTALNFLAQKGLFDLVDGLMTHNSNCQPDAGLSSENRSTVLWYASQASTVPVDLINKILTHRNLDVNARPTLGAHKTVLGYLAEHALQQPWVEFINENYPGADFNASITEGPQAGLTPLWTIANQNNRQLFRSIMEKPRDYNFNATEASSGKSVFHLVVKNSWWEEALEIIEKHDITVLGKKNDINEDGPLRHAIIAKQWDLVSKMIAKLPKSFTQGHLIGREIPIIWLLILEKQFDLCTLLLHETDSSGSLLFTNRGIYRGENSDDDILTQVRLLLSWFFDRRTIPYRVKHRLTQCPSRRQIDIINVLREDFLKAAQIKLNSKSTTPEEGLDLALNHIKSKQLELYQYLGRPFIEKIFSAFELYVQHDSMMRATKQMSRSIADDLVPSRRDQENESCLMMIRSKGDASEQIERSLNEALVGQKIRWEDFQSLKNNVTEELKRLGKNITPKTIKDTVKSIFSNTTLGR